MLALRFCGRDCSRKLCRSWGSARHRCATSPCTCMPRPSSCPSGAAKTTFSSRPGYPSTSCATSKLWRLKYLPDRACVCVCTCLIRGGGGGDVCVRTNECMCVPLKVCWYVWKWCVLKAFVGWGLGNKIVLKCMLMFNTCANSATDALYLYHNHRLRSRNICKYISVLKLLR